MTARNRPLINCPGHGRAPWSGDVCCGKCGVVYLHPPGELGALPDRCQCGARLLPPDDGGKDFSARAICHECARLFSPPEGEGGPPAAPAA